ncbi:MAG: hypothetical protein M1819_003784 [Sarea resinae]|nr:MAG: hypothetical protein M1819_003784 [Sarea resinae]
MADLDIDVNNVENGQVELRLMMLGPPVKNTEESSGPILPGPPFPLSERFLDMIALIILYPGSILSADALQERIESRKMNPLLRKFISRNLEAIVAEAEKQQEELNGQNREGCTNMGVIVRPIFGSTTAERHSYGVTRLASFYKSIDLDETLLLLQDLRDDAPLLPETNLDLQTILVDGIAAKNLPMMSLDASESTPNIPDRWACNEQQKAAIRLGHSAPSGVAIVHGPPGTGKTATAAKLLLTLVKANPARKILCCSVMNKSLEQLLKQTAAIFQSEKTTLKAVRIWN